LTIKTEELEEGYCPECFEAQGAKNYDFEEIVEEHSGAVRYSCEECGLIITVK
jgi:hypothetical protein